MTRLLGLAAVATLAFGLSTVAVTSAGPAWSHATLVSSSPADGEQVPVPPSRTKKMARRRNSARRRRRN